MSRLLSNRILTIQQFADLMGVHRSTVYRWIDRGEVPTFTLGGKTRISLAAMRVQLPAVHEAILDHMADRDDPPMVSAFI